MVTSASFRCYLDPCISPGICLLYLLLEWVSSPYLRRVLVPSILLFLAYLDPCYSGLFVFLSSYVFLLFSPILRRAISRSIFLFGLAYLALPEASVCSLSALVSSGIRLLVCPRPMLLAYMRLLGGSCIASRLCLCLMRCFALLLFCLCLRPMLFACIGIGVRVSGFLLGLVLVLPFSLSLPMPCRGAFALVVSVFWRWPWLVLR